MESLDLSSFPTGVFPKNIRLPLSLMRQMNQLLFKWQKIWTMSSNHLLQKVLLLPRLVVFLRLKKGAENARSLLLSEKIRKEVEMKKGKKDISLTWKASLFFVKSQGI